MARASQLTTGKATQVDRLYEDFRADARDGNELGAATHALELLRLVGAQQFAGKTTVRVQRDEGGGVSLFVRGARGAFGPNHQRTAGLVAQLGEDVLLRLPDGWYSLN